MRCGCASTVCYPAADVTPQRCALCLCMAVHLNQAENVGNFARQVGGLECQRPSKNHSFLVVVASFAGNHHQKIEISGRSGTLWVSPRTSPQRNSYEFRLGRGRTLMNADTGNFCPRSSASCSTSLLPPINAYGKIELGVFAQNNPKSRSLLLWINQPGLPKPVWRRCSRAA